VLARPYRAAEGLPRRCIQPPTALPLRHAWSSDVDLVTSRLSLLTEDAQRVASRQVVAPDGVAYRSI
jgi:hypothetical protein